jgi:hypothetical protein
MTSLAELHAELLPAATRVGDAPADAPIAWVRVMRARVPAFDALDAGDLAIVPAGVVATLAASAAAVGDDAVAALAAALAAAPVSGVLLVEADDVGGAAPAAGSPLDALAAVLATVAVPALRTGRADAVALERSVIGFLVARSAELERRAASLEADLAALALEGGGAPALVAAVAQFLGRAVALETADGTAVAVHAPAGVPDAVESVARYRARPRRAVALRVPLPAAGGAGGSLALLGGRAVAEIERVVVGRVAGLLALELARDEAVRRAGDQARRSEGLPSDGPPWVMLLARQRRPGVDGDDADARARRDALRRELRLLAPARRMALRGDADSLEVRMVVALGPGGAGPAGSLDADPEGLGFARRIAAFLDRTVAVSRPFAAPHDRPEAEAEARATLEAAAVLPEPPRIARAARLPVYRLMGALHSLPDGERHAAALLAPLLASRPDVRREYLETLGAILEGGGANAAATALGVHRNTIAYRLRRIEALTGWDLADPEVRLALQVALVFVHPD